MKPDMVTLERAVRIVAPFSDHLERDYLAGGRHLVLRMLAEFEIATEAIVPPPKRSTMPKPILSREWFGAAIQSHGGRGKSDYGLWLPRFLRWANDSLRISAKDVRTQIQPPSRGSHEPSEHIEAAGVSWTFPQALAWIATHDPLEVARIGCGWHFGPPLLQSQLERTGFVTSDAERGQATVRIGCDDEESFHPLQNVHGRRRLIGWLAVQTSLHHCECEAGEGAEKWEVCQCLGNAYDQLSNFVGESERPIPEFQPKPKYATFTLTWPAGAYDLKFRRETILATWARKAIPATPSPRVSHSDIEDWCRQGIERGRWNGIDKAWKDFMADPAHKGLSRDDCFRPAWRAAKSR